MEGMILKALSGFYYVDDGASVTACRGRGKLRHAKVTPLVGDRVEFTPLGDGQGALDRVLPRKNQFESGMGKRWERLSSVSGSTSSSA